MNFLITQTGISVEFLSCNLYTTSQILTLAKMLNS